MKAPEIGVICGLAEDGDSFQQVEKFGLKTCQVDNWNPEMWTEDLAVKVKQMAKKRKISIAAMWAGYTGKTVWNFIDGPGTLGIVPLRYRKKRTAELMLAADFAKKMGAPAIITHLGFIPENPTDRHYKGVVEAVKEIALKCKSNGIGFWFETGQETPVTLLRLIEDVGTGNLGINLDPANLILYGKANPVDALDVFGAHVKNLHIKDGLYPTNPMRLGREVQVGQGKVDFPKLLAGLKAHDFKGELIIEREISGEQQEKDIMKTVSYLRRILKRLY